MYTPEDIACLIARQGWLLTRAQWSAADGYSTEVLCLLAEVDALHEEILGALLDEVEGVHRLRPYYRG